MAETQPTRVHIPGSIEELEGRLTGLERLLTAKEWERAAIVAAYVRVVENGGDRRSSSAQNMNDGLMSTIEFAALGIEGLRSRSVVLHYAKAWLKVAGLSAPTPGAEVALPTMQFPPRSASARRAARAEAAAQQAKAEADARARAEADAAKAREQAESAARAEAAAKARAEAAEQARAKAEAEAAAARKREQEREAAARAKAERDAKATREEEQRRAKQKADEKQRRKDHPNEAYIRAIHALSNLALPHVRGAMEYMEGVEFGPDEAAELHAEIAAIQALLDTMAGWVASRDWDGAFAAMQDGGAL